MTNGARENPTSERKRVETSHTGCRMRWPVRNSARLVINSGGSMRRLNTIALSFLFVAMMASMGAAHSLKELESRLGDREKYFQPIDKEAPGFELTDSDARAVEESLLRG